MKATYLHHSGFLVETEIGYYLFDWFGGDLPPLNRQKTVTVFSSHGHQDHYDVRVFDLLAQQKVQAQAVLSKDIPAKKYPAGIPVLKVHAHQAYELTTGVRIETLLSTDAGVAFLVHDPEGDIYHAGDLNDWYWEGEPENANRQMTGSYRHEIDMLQSVDTAFVVLDPRQEDHYADGMLYFLKHVRCQHVYPMHYWDQPEIIGRFQREYPQYADRIQPTEQTKGA